MNASVQARYDVVIIGGAIAGAATALLLRRRQPELRVLIVEKNTAFDWKVGESTVEISSYFLTRVLKLYDYLSREQLPKQSFRFWFHHGDVKRCREASEVGPTQLARTPAFQLDRSTMDEHVLNQAAREGVELWRPGKVTSLKLAEDTGEQDNVLAIEHEGTKKEIRAGWVVDATGRTAMIARMKKMLKPLEAHPTAALWARFKNVKDLDGHEVGSYDPADSYVRRCIVSRRLATNHFTGYGYWIWFIPLKNGMTSIGLVYDKRLVEPKGTSPEDKLLKFLNQNPLTRELIEHAKVEPGDVRYYGHLPYLVDRFVGKGWSLVGDAAGFLDPFYSPGLDQMSFSASWTEELIRRWKAKPDAAAFQAEIDEHNRRYANYFRFLFESIYLDKYYLMGDYDTMTCAFLTDTASYYLVANIPLYRKCSSRILYPPFYGKNSEIANAIIKWWKGRLISIAKRKKELGIYGSRNAGVYPSFVGFSVRSAIYVMLAHGLLRWIRAEFFNALTYVYKPKPMTAQMPIPPAPEPSREVQVSGEELTVY